MEQNTQKNKDKKQNNKRANRILYIAIAVVLCAGAIVAGVLLSGSEDAVIDSPVVNEPDSPAGGTPVDPTTVLPEFVSPAVGIVGMKHDPSMPVYSQTMDDWRVHQGIDIVATLGDKVMAAADGTVESVTDDPMLGTTVVISHNGSAKTIYSNLAPELAEGIEAGVEVSCGQVIGAIGETATLEIAEEPHLHFQMTIKDEQVDPMDYITDESASASLGQDIGYEG